MENMNKFLCACVGDDCSHFCLKEERLIIIDIAEMRAATTTLEQFKPRFAFLCMGRSIREDEKSSHQACYVLLMQAFSLLAYIPLPLRQQSIVFFASSSSSLCAMCNSSVDFTKSPLCSAAHANLNWYSIFICLQLR
ncbi:hypothetical protein T10_8625 [Trichinella papuae]|uniref:Uncharacterized protein n=1 Tax=Trichinella papuae TaxID=268474 RepID=A0A0V1MDW8_9BILA|nr:hypothetical protein T10_8625 [Trichinella papuae]